MSTAADVQAAFAAVLVDEWSRAGVTDAVVAPGSRSTPLLAALAADGRLRLHVVLDERSAGFVALGLGVATGRPAVVVTTSGTAAVELHPAVVEAHHAGIPLVAVTADRPPELHQVGAPQTVVQAGLYGGSVRFAADPGVATEASSGSWRSLAARVVAEATGHPAGPGPVHLNVHLREPLLGTPGDLPPGREDGGPWHLTVGSRRLAPPDEIVELLAGASGGRGLIVAGAGSGTGVIALAEALRWPVLADPRSGARVPHPLVVSTADSLLRLPEVASWRPDVVLRLGRPWASKVLAQWLTGLAGAATQVLVDPTGAWVDPDHTAELVVPADPALLGDAVAAAVAKSAGPAPRPGTTRPAPWAEQWARAEAVARVAIDEQLAREHRPTEAAVARAVVAAVPAGATLLTSSSMPVRDVEWWGAPRRDLTVVANRGANGIDGVVSTAIGLALGTGAPTFAVTGDLAWLYDAGALLWAARRPVQLTFVVVDNDGGGIFSFLPQATALPEARFEQLWATPHGGDLPAVAAAFGVPARVVDDVDELAELVAEPPAGVSVLVVRTDRHDNVAAHDRLNAAVAGALRHAAGWKAGA
jgi:2-succinyl-5-enolpyruvyl-6-hydroxy-3-cyclohexene-1-carboxylate synthase